MGTTLITLGALGLGVASYCMLSNNSKRKAKKLLKEMAYTAKENL